MKRLLLILICWTSALCAIPQAIVFDFGGVIADVDRAPLITFITSSLKADAKNDLAGDKLYRALNEGNEFWQQYAASHHKTLSAGWMLRLEELAGQIVHPLPGMQALVAQLKAQGFRVALLSNTACARSRFFRNQGYYRPFDPIVLSCEVNVKKPDPQIYQILLQKLGLPAEACLFIDNKKENIDAAKRLGFEAILFKSPEQLKADLAKKLTPLAV